MSLLDLLKAEAVKRGVIAFSDQLDPATVFGLVRDMPYQRASDRTPETTIREWRGTCSGKHYLLKELFDELGLKSTLIACTSITPVEPQEISEGLFELYDAANRHFVDVHNYLILAVPGNGQMIVDATWPLSAFGAGLVVNEEFVLGQDQEIATEPLQTWIVPQSIDAQAFKDYLLHEHFTPAELAFREIVITALSAQDTNTES